MSVERAAARANGGVSGFSFPSGSRGVYRFVSFSSVRMRRMIACEPVAVLRILVSHAGCEWRLTASGLSARVRPFGGHIALLVVSDDHQSMRRQAFANPFAA